PVRGASVHARGLRPRGVRAHLALTARPVWPSAVSESVGTPEFGHFRGSIPGLHFPLSTLHLRPRGRRCMTRGRCGRLLLHRTTLSFAAPRRFDRRTGDGAPAPVHALSGHAPRPTRDLVSGRNRRASVWRSWV